MRSAAKHMRGFALVSAIFILVVLAALGAFIVNISTSQHIGSALDVQGVRAYHAARAGIEWGLYKVQSYDPTGATTAGDGFRFGYDCVDTDIGSQCQNRRRCPGGGTSSDDTFPAPVFGFTVRVRCSAVDDGANGGPTVYTVTSTACGEPYGGVCPNTTNPDPLYIERRIDVVF